MTEEQAKKHDAKQEPVKEELNEEQLEGVSGGEIVGEVPCPSYSLNEEELQSLNGGGASRYRVTRK